MLIYDSPIIFSLSKREDGNFFFRSFLNSFEAIARFLFLMEIEIKQINFKELLTIFVS